MNYQRYKKQLTPILKNKNVKTYSSLSLSVVAITIFIIFAIKPTFENILELQKQIETQQGILDQLKDKSDRLAQAVNNYNSIPAETKLKLSTLLPNTPNTTCLIDTLATHVSQAQVETVGLQIQPHDLKGQSKCVYDGADLAQIEKNNSAASTLQEIPFTINISATYPNLTTFVNSLNASTRLISIDSGFFNRSVDNPLILSLTGKAYFYK